MINEDNNDGEGGGAERAPDAEDDETNEDFNLQTVFSDDTYVRGYLYKTAQSIGMFQSDLFIRRYY